MANETTLPINSGFPPLANNDAEVLILGSMPGIKSLEEDQYYAHPRNAFWPIMARLLGFDNTLTYGEKCQQLITNKIAVWDVVKLCQRPGSLDQHIVRDSIVCNDFEHFFTHHTSVRRVCFNGTKAEALFNRYVFPSLSAPYQLLEQLKLPSSSPAHASMTSEQKLRLWQQILV